MKTTTICILSGLFGALFAVACGVVDGVGSKDATASDVLLAKYVVTGTCTFEFNGYSPYGFTVYPSEYDDAMDDIKENNGVWSMVENCTCPDSDQNSECDDSEDFNDTFRLVYIK